MATQNMIERAYSITPTATTIASWDANKNMSANNVLAAYTTTATAAGTTTLTVGSTYNQFFTGSTTQTVVLPVTSTLVLGHSFYIVNSSSGVVTVQSSGANTVVAMAANTSAFISCILTSGTTAASWFADYIQSGLTLPVSIENGGTSVTSVTTTPTATSWAGWDANKNLSANSLINGYTTTATAAGTTTLTVGSTGVQFFTGSTTQTVVMPVTSTLVLGQQFTIYNNSTGNVTINSSGSNAIVVLTANSRATLTCILTSGTTAASWFAAFMSTPVTAPIQTWVSFAGSGTVATINGSLNVTSVTRNTAGHYTSNYTSSYADTNYACIMSSGTSAAAWQVSNVATGSCQVVTGGTDAVYYGVSNSGT